MHDRLMAWWTQVKILIFCTFQHCNSKGFLYNMLCSQRNCQMVAAHMRQSAYIRNTAWRALYGWERGRQPSHVGMRNVVQCAVAYV